MCWPKNAINYSPLVHVVFGVVQPNPNLHGVSFAAPLKYVFHVVGETAGIRRGPEGKSVWYRRADAGSPTHRRRRTSVASSLKHTKFGNTKINRVISGTAVFATDVNSDNGPCAPITARARNYHGEITTVRNLEPDTKFKIINHIKRVAPPERSSTHVRSSLCKFMAPPSTLRLSTR